MKKTEEILKFIKANSNKYSEGLSATDVGEALRIDRTNSSRYLNRLCDDGLLFKAEGRPVKYFLSNEKNERIIPQRRNDKKFTMDMLIGAGKSLNVQIQQAKAAILYPPRGLHTLILGETGVGKSMFAELMYQFAVEANMLLKDAPFVRFNCADYGENPQLLMAQIFGVKKGAYTGAEKDREGLIKKADKGMLFLDEVHRLSAQGQEMLFTFIDKGYFSRLGDSEERVVAEVQIIAATTENPDSSLLKTFQRRIPMTIMLPPLRERGLKDRYKLIATFFKEESKRLSKSIYINKNAIESLILYDCPSNIGQLKSDIQLACAKAFLNFKSNQKSYILIEQSDLPQHVKQGYMNIKSHRAELEALLKNQDDIFKFYFDEDETYLDESYLKENTKEPHFYEKIERRVEELRAEGKTELEVTSIMSTDIEKHFQNYIVAMPEKFKREELEKIVDIKIVKIVEAILSHASKALEREYDEKIYFGLALHLKGSLERIKNNQSIYHPRLNYIRVNYSREFIVAMELAKQIDEMFEVVTPLDEIGYLAMFLASNSYEMENEAEGKVGILVIMHGNTTASSMTQVSLELVGDACCEALDMPLSMKPQTMYEIAKETVRKLDNGKGVLMLVDMGSPFNFADMIYEETGIITKAVDRVSTPMVIEACRKSNLNRELLEIYRSCLEMLGKGSVEKMGMKKPLIITACFTGEGAGEQLRRMVEAQGRSCEVISLSFLNRREFKNMLSYYQEKYDILAIVGTVDIEINDIPFISAVEYLSGDGSKRLEELIEREDMYQKIQKSLREHIKSVDGEMLLQLVRRFIENVEGLLHLRLNQDVKVGIALHLSFLIDNVVQRNNTKSKESLDEFIDKYSMEMEIVRGEFKVFESKYEIKFSELDIAYVLKMFISNNLN